MKIVVALAGSLVALASVSANATFIYLNHGASASQSVVAGLASNIAGIAAAAAQGSAAGIDSQSSRSGDTWRSSSGYSSLRRSWVEAFSVPTQRQKAEGASSGVTSTAESIAADVAVAAGTAAAIAEGMAPAVSLETSVPAVLADAEAPQVTLGTIAADLGAFTDASVVVGQTQGVPEPSTLVMLGFGLLGVFAVARRRSRRKTNEHSFWSHPGGTN